ncbi:MAG: hypothetical protein AUK44_07020 [Porphyromonadaceae bacterium CG2_30_38_12]|nr:MAG: hypothetical protein AUK44_07020 [Porphyromonadaceae bacterium CG2_30_38_12]
MKAVTYYLLEGGVSGGTKPNDTSNAIFSETFAASSQGGFIIQDVILPNGFTSVWFPTATYGMKATADKSSVNYAAESWLISPVINLTNINAAKLIFDHVGRFFNDKITQSTLWVSEDYLSGLPTTASWSKITIPTYTDGTNWNFVHAGIIDLSSFAGKNIRFAFKYLSTDTSAGTWEVKNVTINNATTIVLNPKINNSFKAYISNGSLYLNSLGNGAFIEIYNTLGTLILSSKVSNSTLLK